MYVRICVESLARLLVSFLSGNLGTFACLFLKPWYVCTRVFGNPGTLACPFLKSHRQRVARLASFLDIAATSQVGRHKSAKLDWATDYLDCTDYLD